MKKLTPTYIYVYIEVFLWQKANQFKDLIGNIQWILRNGPYTGEKKDEDSSV